MKPSSRVFVALKNGTLVKEISNIESDQLKSFMPVLMLGAFRKAHKTEALNEICAKLIDYQAGNQILQLMKLDYSEIRGKIVNGEGEVKKSKTSKNFHQLNLEEKLLHVCKHIQSQMTKWNILTSLPNYADAFDPFDIEHCHEEVTWLVSMACFYMPDLFDLQHFAASMLFYVHGPKLLSYFAANQPHMFDIVLHTIMAIKCQEEEGFLGKQRNDAILKLLEMNDKATVKRFINDVLDSNATNLHIIIQLLCSNIIDDESFIRIVSASLTRKDEKLSAFLTKTGNRVNLRKLCDRINGIIDRTTNAKTTVELVILMAMFCTTFTLRLAPTDALKWITFLTNQTKPMEDLLKTTLCTILISHQLIPQTPKDGSLEAESRLIEFFQWVREAIKNEPGRFYSLNQLILLITVHFNSNKVDELAFLYTTILGFPIQTISRKSNLLKSLFMNNIASDRDLVERSSRINVTKNLSSKSVGPLPVHTITQILRTKNWSRDNIKPWIKEQILECELPLHPIIGTLLEMYAQCCIPDQNQPYLEPMDEEFFHDLFSTDIYDNTKLVPRVLSLYYILVYTYALDIKPLAPKFQVGTGPLRYSNELWAKIPIRYLLSLVDASPSDFQPVLSMCFKLTAIFLPHMMPTLTESLEYRHGDVEENRPISNATSLVPVEQLSSEMKELSKNPTVFERLVIRVNASPIQAQHQHFKTIAEAMSLTLNPSISRKIAEKVCAIWHRLENIVPRHIYEATFRNWLTDRTLFENEILVSKPMMLFKVDERVFTSPPHFQCFVNMLAFYLDANRASYQTQLNRNAIQNYGNPNVEAEAKERSSLYEAYENAQNSTIIQMLLEICDGDPLEKTYLEEIRRIACGHIHEMFISNINLAKLVHFQTYPLRLISVMIKGVPSTHVVINYIGDLLLNSNIKRRIFAIALMAELIDQYKIVESFNNLELIVSVLETLLDAAPSEQNIELFLNLISIIERFVQISPFNANSYVELIERVQKFAASRLAIYPSIYMARNTPEKRLLEMSEQSLSNCRSMMSVSRV